MNKSKIITGLSAAFVAVIALASCNTIKANGHVVLKIGNEEFTAEELFKEQRGASVGEAKFNAVYKVAVRKWAQTDGADGGKQFADAVKKETQNKISGQKDTAQSNANKNNTSYDTEWEKILKSNNVDDEQGLYDKFEYEIQKTKFDDQFYEKKLDVLKSGGYLDAGEGQEIHVDGYLDKKQPYHVKHILVKVSAAAGDPATGEITEAEAIKLSKVVKSLAEGTDFGLVAKLYSDDATSAKNFGDLGIMDKDTSFVNEFKLGTYLYESYFGSSTKEDEQESSAYYAKNAKNALGLNDETTPEQAGYYAKQASVLADPSGCDTSGNGQGIGQIPLEAALVLSKGDWTLKSNESTPTTLLSGKGYADIDYKSKGFSSITGDDKAKFYPRNVIFNKYFNKNNIMVITPSKLTRDVTTTDKVKTEIENTINTTTKKRKKNDAYKGTYVSDLTTKLNGFKVDAKNNDVLNVNLYDDSGITINKKILRDNRGRAIFVFRSGTTGDSSYQGIHFVCIERSPFIGKEYDAKYEAQKTEAVTRDEYFTYYFPNQEGGHYPTYTEEGELKGTNKLTYVNYINDTDPSALKTRADTVKSKIKSHDSNLNTYVYEYLVKKGDLKFKDGDELAQGIKNDINTWIERKREDSEETTKDTWNKTWKTYYQKLNETTKVRTPENRGASEADYVGGTISEACALAYAYLSVNEDGQYLKDLFDKGGVFHE